MNAWLLDILPAVWWLRFYVLFAAMAGIGLLYILEQIVVHGNAHFSHVITHLYRIAMVVMLIGLFADVMLRLATSLPPSPSLTLFMAGLALLSMMICITHKRHHDFGA